MNIVRCTEFSGIFIAWQSGKKIIGSEDYVSAEAMIKQTQLYVLKLNRQ